MLPDELQTRKGKHPHFDRDKIIEAGQKPTDSKPRRAILLILIGYGMYAWFLAQKVLQTRKGHSPHFDVTKRRVRSQLSCDNPERTTFSISTSQSTRVRDRHESSNPEGAILRHFDCMPFPLSLSPSCSNPEGPSSSFRRHQRDATCKASAQVATPSGLPPTFGRIDTLAPVKALHRFKPVREGCK